MASISAAIGSAKALKDILQAVTELKIDTKVLDRIHDAQRQVTDVLGALLETQGEFFKLQIEAQGLREQLKTHEDWEKIEAQYRMVKTDGGATLYESVENSPKHYICPGCYAKRIKIPLQDTNGYYFACPVCKASYKVKTLPPMGNMSRESRGTW